MVVTFPNLSGTRENFDLVIKDLLLQQWDNTNTSTITPQFQSDTEEPDKLARPDETDTDTVFVNLVSREIAEDVEDEPNSDTIHSFKTIINISIMAQTLPLLGLFEDEVNRILWEFAPNAATRLNKSNAAASEADRFDRSEITFERLEPADDTFDVNPESEGQLGIMWRRNRA